MSVVSVVCGQEEVSATGQSLVQRRPTQCGASNRGWSRSLDKGRSWPSRGCCALGKNANNIVHLVSLFITRNYYYYYYYYIIPFTQGIHSYMPETNHVSRVHSVAATLHVLLMVHIALSSILKSFVLLHYYYYYYYYYYYCYYYYYWRAL
jgi:hypothetical protein